MIKIIGVGDIMSGGLLNDSDQPCANKEVIDLLQQGDVRCGTLECALGNEPTYDEAKLAKRDDGIYSNVIYAKDADIRRLKELHIDIVSLANNHFFDLGEAGASHTIELLDKEGGEIALIVGNHGPDFDGGMQAPKKIGVKQRVKNTVMDLYGIDPLQFIPVNSGTLNGYRNNEKVIK